MDKKSKNQPIGPQALLLPGARLPNRTKVLTADGCAPLACSPNLYISIGEGDTSLVLGGPPDQAIWE